MRGSNWRQAFADAALEAELHGAGFEHQIATGPFQRSVIPPIAPKSTALTQIHSADYRNPDQLPEGGVLVVGVVVGVLFGVWSASIRGAEAGVWAGVIVGGSIVADVWSWRWVHRRLPLPNPKMGKVTVTLPETGRAAAVSEFAKACKLD